MYFVFQWSKVEGHMGALWTFSCRLICKWINRSCCFFLQNLTAVFRHLFISPFPLFSVLCCLFSSSFLLKCLFLLTYCRHLRRLCSPSLGRFSLSFCCFSIKLITQSASSSVLASSLPTTPTLNFIYHGTVILTAGVLLACEIMKMSVITIVKNSLFVQTLPDLFLMFTTLHSINTCIINTYDDIMFLYRYIINCE